MMVNKDDKEFSFRNLLNRNIFQNKWDININFLLPYIEKLVFEKFRDNLCAFSQTEIFASLLVTMKMN